VSDLLLSLLVAGGAGLIVAGILLRARERERQLAEILDLPFGERDVPHEAIEQRAALLDSTVGLASKVVDQFDAKGSLSNALERARIPMRSGEFVTFVTLVTFIVAMVLWALTRQWYFVVAAVVLAPLGARFFLNYRVNHRRKKLEEQLPDALSLIASSLAAGHTFLRAVQMMTEEAAAPLSEEFERVIYETRLGDPLVDCLERMSQRMEIRDLEWVVQAIRVQQTVGGKLADLLHTLADFMRSREDVRREVDVLTAEGRISAYVLGALPVGLLVVISTMNPHYMKPMFRGWGLWWLGGMAVSIVVGMGVILKMVNIEV
jgi:Flp pilus assembly protein TadB